MDNIGGAEYVDLVLAQALGADIYTTNINQGKIAKLGFSTDNIFSIGSVPVNQPLRNEAAHQRFKRLNLGTRYDAYIIAGDWAMAAAIHNKPNLWYIYSPAREIWDAHEFTRQTLVPAPARPLFTAWAKHHRRQTLQNLQHINRFVAISENVRSRVQRYLRRDAVVVHPPTDTQRFRYQGNGDFWLSVNRLFHHKRVELQLQAFSMLPQEQLVIVGSYERSRHFRRYAQEMERLKPANVTLLHWVDAQALVDLYARCRGFLTTSMDEDYGMGPVEAMAAGKPVIAPNEGGYRETVIDGQTGVLIDAITPEKIVAAIGVVGPRAAEYQIACQKRAQQFDVSIFISKMQEQLNELIK